MSLIIATGSNIGDSLQNLNRAKHELSKHFKLIATSRVYSSPAIDYLDQPDFFNQVLEFEMPLSIETFSILKICQQIELDLGRKRKIAKGPRTIDIDILFLHTLKISTPSLEVPHPRLFERSFVVLPLKELPYFKTLEQLFLFS